MNTTIINDCRDENAKGRQITRAQSLIGGTVSFIGVGNDLEAGGNLIDVLDAEGESEGVVLVNVAPRNGKAKRWNNGTPFCYFWHKKTLVVSSVDGLTLSLVKKLNLTDILVVLDIPAVLEKFVAEKIIEPKLKGSIAVSQFRSFDFLPRVAVYLLKNKKLGGEQIDIGDIPDAPNAVWWVDNFGNCKTTLLKKDIEDGRQYSKKFWGLKYYERLKDVPDKHSALIIGSSGIGDNRFLEVVVQGGNAQQILGIGSKDLVV